MHTTVFIWLDTLLISPYRWIGIPIVGYYLGTAVLCVYCVIIGHLTVCASVRFNRTMLRDQNQEMVHKQNLSVYALLSKKKSAYKALNDEANDAFGRVFFSHLAISAASLWPIPFALAWMQSRFGAVDFMLPVRLPGIGDHVGYAFTFFPLFILTYIGFGKIKRHLAFGRAMERQIEAIYEGGEELVTLADLTLPQK